MIVRKSLLFLLLLFLSQYVSAKIALPSLFQDGMVLQQNSYANIWGNASAGESIEVFASWDSIGTTTFADTKGKWLVQIPTPAAGGPYRILIKGEDQVEIKDVLIGEVWIASGQSNMEWSLELSEGGKTEVAAANSPTIRFFKVKKTVSSTPRIDCEGKWQSVNSSQIADKSAVAWYFAQKLQKELDIPIGIIQTAWGGTPAEAWTPRDALESQADFQPMMRAFDEALSRHREFPNQFPDPIQAKNPGILYNSMLSPLIPFTIRGVIWYQGESNTYDPWLYRKLFPFMVQSWRRKWGYRFSFYYVQIAPFKYGTPLSGTGIREAQIISRRIARSGMVSTMDLGNPADIHPRNKKPVGERLAHMALVKDYEKTGFPISGPVFKEAKTVSNKLELTFHFAANGLKLDQEETNFILAGEDRVFYPAKAETNEGKLILSSPNVPVPVACRYAWKDEAEASLFNQEGLPASSFRTDKWPVFFSKVQINPTYKASLGEFEVSLSYAGSEPHAIRYTINGAEPSLNSPLYEKPFLVKAPLVVKATAAGENSLAHVVSTQSIFQNRAWEGKILRQTKANPTYSGKGRNTLVNGVEAQDGFRDSEWLGYRDKEVEVVMDFGEKKQFQAVQMRFIQQLNVMIDIPEKIEILYSSNGRKYRLLDKSHLDSLKLFFLPKIHYNFNL
ncbi:MAG: sialate O-acetylesterase, partial [Bacteroidota bacterium]